MGRVTVRPEQATQAVATVGTTQKTDAEPPQAENTIVSDVNNSLPATEADHVMSNWDDEIWAEETANTALSQDAPEPVDRLESSKGWLASLALMSPSLLLRKKKKK